MSEVQETPVKPVLSPGAAKRANASVRGMILALLVSIAVFIPLYLINPAHRASTYERYIDVPGIAQEAAVSAGYLPLAPMLPANWRSNYARWNVGTTTGVPDWEVGYLTPAGEYIGLTETTHANPTWVSQTAHDAPVTGNRQIGGQAWQLREKPNTDKSLVLALNGTTVILSGTASLEEFDVLGAAVVRQLTEPAPAASPATASQAPASPGAASPAP